VIIREIIREVMAMNETIISLIVTKETVTKIETKIVTRIVTRIITRTAVTKIDTKTVVTKTAATKTAFPNQYNKEETINIITKNLNIALKTMIQTKDKEEDQAIQMKKVNCLMKAIDCQKINHQENMTNKDKSKITDLEIMMIDKETLTISKD